MYERILVPLNSAKVAEAVLPYTEELIGHLQAEVTLLYVCEPAEERNRRAHELYLGIIAEGVTRDVSERYPGKRRARIKVKSVVLSGKPVEEIVDYANKNNFSLIIVATRSHLGMMHRRIGHTAEKALQAASMPILLVTTTEPHLEPGPRQLLDSVLLPLDGSEISETALTYVTQLTKKQWTRVTLLRVVAPVQQVRTLRGLDYVRFTEQEIETMKVNAKQYLENVAKKLEDTKAFIRCEVRVGNAGKEIINLANEIDARLVVVLSSHDPWIRHWISGSMAEKVLLHTKAPVLLVKAPG